MSSLFCLLQRRGHLERKIVSVFSSFMQKSSDELLNNSSLFLYCLYVLFHFPICHYLSMSKSTLLVDFENTPHYKTVSGVYIDLFRIDSTPLSTKFYATSFDKTQKFLVVPLVVLTPSCPLCLIPSSYFSLSISLLSNKYRVSDTLTSNPPQDSFYLSVTFPQSTNVS